MSNVTLLPTQRIEYGGTYSGRVEHESCRPVTDRKDHRYRYRRCLAWLLACVLALVGATQATAGPTCKPTLAFKGVEYSAMQLPALERRWTAVVAADASRCASTAGSFEIGFSRAKENGIEIEFREPFIWSSPSVTVGVDFWADEFVEAYWIDTVQTCPCAKGVN